MSAVTHQQQKKPASAPDRSSRYDLLFVVWFCLFLTLTGALTVLLPKNEISVIERRELQKMPQFSVQSLLAGQYTRQLELYFADNFVLRDDFVRFANYYSEHLGLRFDEIRVYSDPNAYESAAASSQASESSSAPSSSQPAVLGSSSAAVQSPVSSASESSVSQPSSTEENRIGLFRPVRFGEQLRGAGGKERNGLSLQRHGAAYLWRQHPPGGELRRDLNNTSLLCPMLKSTTV
jgi:hypothetical protein